MNIEEKMQPVLRKRKKKKSTRNKKKRIGEKEKKITLKKTPIHENESYSEKKSVFTKTNYESQSYSLTSPPESPKEALSSIVHPHYQQNQQ